VEHARAASTAFVRGEHLVGNRRGEDLARTCCVEHPEPDEAAVHRLVAGAAARDEADLARDRRVLAQDELVVEVDPDEVRVGVAKAGEGGTP